VLPRTDGRWLQRKQTRNLVLKRRSLSYVLPWYMRAEMPSLTSSMHRRSYRLATTILAAVLFSASAGSLRSNFFFRSVVRYTYKSTNEEDLTVDSTTRL